MYVDSKDLAERTVSHKVLEDRANEIQLNPLCDGHKKRFASKYGISVFWQKTGSRANINEVLAQEQHKPVIKKIKRRKVYSRFKDNIWVADLAETRSLSFFDFRVNYLLFIILLLVFSRNILELILWGINKLKPFLMVLSK